MSREKNNHSRLWYSFLKKKRKKRTFSPAFSSPKTQRNISRICRKIRTMWKREKKQKQNKTKKKHETRILKALCLTCLLSFYSTCLFNGWLLSAFFLSLYPELLCKWYKYVCPPPGWLLWFFFSFFSFLLEIFFFLFFVLLGGIFSFFFPLFLGKNFSPLLGEISFFLLFFLFYVLFSFFFSFL